jgi:hypothetical protein
MPYSWASKQTSRASEGSLGGSFAGRFTYWVSLAQSTNAALQEF